MAETPRAQDALSASGMGLAVGCYAIWGLTPIYWKAMLRGKEWMAKPEKVQAKTPAA